MGGSSQRWQLELQVFSDGYDLGFVLQTVLLLQRTLSWQQDWADCSLLENICGEYLKYASLERVSVFVLLHAICITLSPLQNMFENKNLKLAALFLPHQSAFFCLKGLSSPRLQYPPTAPTPEESKATLSSTGIKMNKNIMRLSMFND